MKNFAILVLLVVMLLFSACGGETPAVSGTSVATTDPSSDAGTSLTILSWNPPLDGALDALSEKLAAKGFSVNFEVRLLKPNSPSQVVKAYAEQLPQSDLTMFYDYAVLCAVYDERQIADLPPMRMPIRCCLQALPTPHGAPRTITALYSAIL